MAHEFDPNKLPISSYEFFKDYIALLGASNLAEALAVSTTTAYNQAEDPDLSPQPVRNRLDHLRVLLRRLENIDRVDLAVSGLQFLADSIGMTVIPKCCPMPDEDSLEAELLDDLKPLADLHRAIQDGAPLAEIERLAGKAKEEIDQDVTMYRQKNGAD